MLTLPAELTHLYETLLTQQGVARQHHPHYTKWLRYYWDFCHKYGFEPWKRQSFPPFDEKLRTKNQSDFQRQQAHHAVSLYYESVLRDCDGGQRPRVGLRMTARKISVLLAPVLSLPPGEWRRPHHWFAP